MMAQPRVRKASWMSSRISQRMRRRRNQCYLNAEQRAKDLADETGAVPFRSDAGDTEAMARLVGDVVAELGRPRESRFASHRMRETDSCIRCDCGRDSPGSRDVLGEEVADQVGDGGGLGLQGEVAGVEQVDLGVGHVLGEGAGTV